MQDRERNLKLVDLVLPIIGCPVLYQRTDYPPETRLGESIVREIVLLTGHFSGDSPQLEAVRQFLDEHTPELIRCIVKLNESQQLRPEDVAFLDGFPHSLRPEW